MATAYAAVRLHRVSSTQDEARDRFSGDPLLVIADRQTRGRGRAGREWWEAPRAVYASLAFAPEWPPPDRPVLSLVAALAARSALAGPPWLKWPNDLVLAGGGKVGGLLVETSGDLVVAGLGVNLWWPAPPPGAAAVHDDDPGAGAAPAVARAWATGLLERAARPVAGWGRDEYRACCGTLGGDITWVGGPGPGRGRAVDVGADGSLLVATAAGEVRLVSGEVREVRAATLDGRLPEETA